MKTKKELREEVILWERVSTILFVLMILIVISAVVRIHGFETKLQVCENKIPLCDVQNGYYGFEAKCEYWNWEVRDKHHYNTLEECEEAYLNWDSLNDCEVIK